MDKAPDWSDLPKGATFAEVDGKPVVMLPDGRCLGGWTAKSVPYARVSSEGMPIDRAEFDRLVASAFS